jgi:hypothetical protein
MWLIKDDYSMMMKQNSHAQNNCFFLQHQGASACHGAFWPGEKPDGETGQFSFSSVHY